ncbi:hypothetical protein [Nostoc sp. CCY0012]|uniref:hypothetical protein n=1 Tax=Nostoc sp. CCY0012 TaxID=1056123 RepID=UPI0039C6FB0C
MAHTQDKLAATAREHGGLIWAIDALQPEGHGTLLYVLYEVLSGTPVSGIQLPQAQGQQLIEWLQPYQKLPYKVLATLASDLEEAHQWLRRIADCLRYTEDSKRNPENVTNIIQTHSLPLTSLQVRHEMEELLQKFQPDPQQNPAQFALKKKLQRLWDKYGTNLLHCYDVPGLPPDNLKMEAMFSRLRRNQRRISGRKSTVELRDFGQYQVLFLAESEKQLLAQIQQVPITEYKIQRRRLALSEAPRQQKHRLHHDPVSAIQSLVHQHQEILSVLEFQALSYQLDS